ncbi:hypothetical protein [Flavobacterium collinsii]|uniref:Phage integrase SAM-like domain-containing protein n=1 Tax=Flavobacterium collinsii TaxID=1114861 RepID=A0ABN7ER75_9FLAO|nr:hypothetical protein [Flavobacterium collinsii]CAA9203299.1 hypothetical protein FLACOL7796_04684 [Flavobacterium collinsii]
MSESKLFFHKSKGWYERLAHECNFAKKMDDAFGRYKGLLTKEEWLQRYKTLYKNREIGKLTEEEFQLLEGGLKPKKGIKTSDGKRYFDNVLDEIAREVKSGPVTLSKYKDQILKDIEIISEGLAKDITKIEWHCFSEVDPNVLEFIKKELKNRKISEDLFIVKKY